MALYVSKGDWDITMENNNWAGDPRHPDYPVVGLEMEDNKGRIYSPDQIAKGELPSGNISVDPRFQNPEKGDWRLKNNSPMIDAGVKTGQRFCGSTPDMGMIEHCP